MSNAVEMVETVSKDDRSCPQQTAGGHPGHLTDSHPQKLTNNLINSRIVECLQKLRNHLSEIVR